MSKERARKRAERKFNRMLQIKRSLFQLQAGVCLFCEGEFSLSRPATIEHLVPRALGGSNKFDNLALTHAKCNQKRDVYSWIAAYTFFSNPEIRRYWKRFIVTGYIPRIHRLSVRFASERSASTSVIDRSS